VLLVLLQLVGGSLEIFGGTLGTWLKYVMNGIGVVAGVILVRWQLQTMDGISDVIHRMDRIAQGNMSESCLNNRSDELGDMYNAMIAMQTHLKVMLAEIVEAAERLRVDSSELENRVSLLHAEAAQQSESVTRIAANVEELSSAVHEVAVSADNAAGEAQGSRQLLDEAVASMREGRAASERMVDTVNQASQTMRQLFEAIRKIDTVSDGIKEISGQTNLLALNAAIEAARAGEAGRGFAVVADEVRKLAERAGSQTSEISQIVAEVQVITRQALAVMEQTGREVSEADKAMNHTDEGLGQVSAKSETVNSLARHIARAAAEESRATEDISGHLARIVSGIEDNLKHQDNVRERSEQLAGIAHSLQTLVSYFRLDRP
jgi:aerotaxis receptor